MHSIKGENVIDCRAVDWECILVDILLLLLLLIADILVVAYMSTNKQQDISEEKSQTRLDVI